MLFRFMGNRWLEIGSDMQICGLERKETLERHWKNFFCKNYKTVHTYVQYTQYSTVLGSNTKCPVDVPWEEAIDKNFKN